MSDFVPGLEGVVAFESEIAEPDKEGSALRYRGVDIEDLVGRVCSSTTNSTLAYPQRSHSPFRFTPEMFVSTFSPL